MLRSLLVPASVALSLSLGAVPIGHSAEAADLVLAGRITTADGSPLGGANVSIAADGLSAGADAGGQYRLVLPARLRGTKVMVRVRAIGYRPETRQVALSGDSTEAHFALKADVLSLEQVVVTGAAASSLYGRAPVVQLRSASVLGGGPPAQPARGRDLRGEEYARIVDNPFRSPRVAPLSTFGVDVDRASYSNVRRMISVDHQRPPVDAVRIEELINYFPYEYAPPTNQHPFAVRTDVAAAPWAREHLLVRIALQARTIDLASAPANNLVFLIDVSGSMGTPDKLPLLKQAFRMLVEQLREQDRVAIVVYAGSSGLALPSTSGADKQSLLGAIDRLESGGSTAGGAGIRLAYDVAKANFMPRGNNRVILATDGDFNVGVTDNAELEKLITQRREEGTALTVLGFGAENIRDNRMEMLADKGNGNYSYIDTPLEARKVLVQEIGGTLVTVAKDVKLQVEFNPAVVAGYRLIGYENRVLNDADFTNDKKDAGDMGAGHSVTAMYEIIPVGARDADAVRDPEERRYTRTSPASSSGDLNELLFVKFRYKAPNDSVSVPLEVAVPNRVTAASDDFRFAQAVAAFGMVLRESEHRGEATPRLALELAQGALGKDPGGYRADFVRLVAAFTDLPAARTSKGRE